VYVLSFIDAKKKYEKVHTNRKLTWEGTYEWEVDTGKKTAKHKKHLCVRVTATSVQTKIM